MFREFAAWIGNTTLSHVLQNTLWVIPISQSIHILSVGVLFTSTMLINMRILGLKRTGRSVSQLADTLIPWIWGALLLLLFTGTVQTIAEPVRQFVTPVFWVKLAMVSVVAILTAVYAPRIRSHAADRDASTSPPQGSRLFAIISSLLWIAIIVCGRFIGYTWSSYV